MVCKWFPGFLDIPLLPLHLMQVREYFVTQRSRLRNLVQKCSDVGERNLVTNAEVQLQQPPSTATAESNIGFTKLTDGESVDMLLELMRSERTFKGQGQLLQVILQTEPGLILRRYEWSLEVYGCARGTLLFQCRRCPNGLGS
jgi:hypothetical protein